MKKDMRIKTINRKRDSISAEEVEQDIEKILLEIAEIRLHTKNLKDKLFLPLLPKDRNAIMRRIKCDGYKIDTRNKVIRAKQLVKKFLNIKESTPFISYKTGLTTRRIDFFRASRFSDPIGLDLLEKLELYYQHFNDDWEVKIRDLDRKLAENQQEKKDEKIS